MDYNGQPDYDGLCQAKMLTKWTMMLAIKQYSTVAL